MPAIGFLLHPGDESALDDAVAAAERCGYSSWTAVTDPAMALSQHAADTRLLVTVGGDGTFLLGARIAAIHDIPVLGVNRGRLGFLTDVQMETLPAAIEEFASGEAVMERRAMLQATIAGAPPLLDAIALNDVVVKSEGVTVARLHVDADGELLGDFDADGIVVATATGSTAYALSAGGPPVDPRVRATVVVPLAPHAVITRALILPETTRLRITVARGRAIAAADGQSPVSMHEGDTVDVSPGRELQFVRLAGSPPFVQRLREKLRFGTPLKGIGRGSSVDPDA